MDRPHGGRLILALDARLASRHMPRATDRGRPARLAGAALAAALYVLVMTWASAARDPDSLSWTVLFVVASGVAGLSVARKWALLLPLVVVAAAPMLGLHEASGTSDLVEATGFAGIAAGLVLRPVATTFVRRRRRAPRPRAMPGTWHSA